tara:strand:+ start:6000 stop:6341 length:342 start_codon:yes stop_codon:yes gene_type:complete
MVNQITIQKDKRAVMRRVYAVWVTRHLLSPFSVKCYTFLVLSLNLLATVSIGSVLANINGSGVIGFVMYMQYAFLSTGFIVQASILIVFVISVFLLKDIISNSRNSAFAHKFA